MLIIPNGRYRWFWYVYNDVVNVGYILTSAVCKVNQDFFNLISRLLQKIPIIYLLPEELKEDEFQVGVSLNLLSSDFNTVYVIFNTIYKFAIFNTIYVIYNLRYYVILRYLHYFVISERSLVAVFL